MKKQVFPIFLLIGCSIFSQLFSCGKQVPGDKRISASTSDVNAKKIDQQLPQIPSPTIPPVQGTPVSASIPPSKVAWNGAEFVGTSKLTIFPVE